jgi:DNA-binding NarL/FixJ family response regulator
VATEDCPLTTRELEILKLVAGGSTNVEIAQRLWVTEQTVKFHLSNIYRKLEVGNRTQASHYAHINGLVADEPPMLAPRLKLAAAS